MVSEVEKLPLSDFSWGSHSHLLSHAFVMQEVDRIREAGLTDSPDVNPQWMIKYFDELLPLLAKHKNKIEEIRIPIQSGSNKVLNLMRRRYRIEEVYSCIDRLWVTIPTLKIRTHCLVGFPGESLEDFNQTISLIFLSGS